MTKEQKKKIAETVEQMGGEWIAPVVAAHYLRIGDQAAQTITTARIAQEVKKQEQEEKKAEAAGRVCLMSAEYVGEILTGCQVLASVDDFTRKEIIKKYL